MTATLDSNRTDNSLRSALLLDFALASVEFAKARLQQRSKDTPAHRVAVAAARDRVDVVRRCRLMPFALVKAVVLAAA